MNEGDLRQRLEDLLLRGIGRDVRERLDLRLRIHAMGFLLLYHALDNIARRLEPRR